MGCNCFPFIPNEKQAKQGCVGGKTTPEAILKDYSLLPKAQET